MFSLSKTDQINKLYEAINQQNSYYIAAIGVLVTVIIGLLIFVGFVQLRLTQKEIEKIEKDLSDQFTKEYQFKTEAIKTISVNGWNKVDNAEGMTIHSSGSLMIVNLDTTLELTGDFLALESEFMVDPITAQFQHDGIYQAELIENNEASIVPVELFSGRWKIKGYRQLHVGSRLHIKQFWIEELQHS